MAFSVCFYFYPLKPPFSRLLILNWSGVMQLAMIGGTLTLGFHKSDKRVRKGLYFFPA